jgi:segregation and condensation protein B
MTERSDMEAAIEAILFVSSEPVPRTKLLEMFDEDERAEAAEALEAVLARYADGESRGVMVEDVGGGVRLATRPEVAGWLRRFFDVSGGTKLSMAALETLAIIAYRQPVTGPEVQELRGVNPAGVIKTLLERRLVRISGRKEVVGKPFLYGTTKEFLVHFGLNSLRDLPPLEEFEETFGAVGGAPGGELSAATLDAFTPQPEEAAGEDQEETFLREVAAFEEASADAGEPE